tara:strand:- start:364 stop:537 length:174 start_codon:yes stop_codon:yes gene_type:complete
MINLGKFYCQGHLTEAAKTKGDLSYRKLQTKNRLFPSKIPIFLKRIRDFMNTNLRDF